MVTIEQIQYKDLCWSLKMAAMGGFIFALWLSIVTFFFVAGFSYGAILAIFG